MMDRKITTRPIVSTRHAWVILCPCQKMVERCLIIFFTNHPVHWPWCGFAMNLSLIPPYLLLVIACNACACCVFCGNCLAIDWHNALAACGLQRKAPVVSVVPCRKLVRKKGRILSAEREDEFLSQFHRTGTAHCHPTCIPYLGLFCSCVESDWK